MKPVNQKAWLLILPVVLCVAFSAILPLMTVVNYSVQDIISPERRVFVGTEWFKSVMRDDDLENFGPKHGGAQLDVEQLLFGELSVLPETFEREGERPRGELADRASGEDCLLHGSASSGFGHND